LNACAHCRVPFVPLRCADASQLVSTPSERSAATEDASTRSWARRLACCARWTALSVRLAGVGSRLPRRSRASLTEVSTLTRRRVVHLAGRESYRLSRAPQKLLLPQLPLCLPPCGSPAHTRKLGSNPEGFENDPKTAFSQANAENTECPCSTLEGETPSPETFRRSSRLEQAATTAMQPDLCLSPKLMSMQGMPALPESPPRRRLTPNGASP